MESYLQRAPCLYFAVNDHGQIVTVNDTLCIELGYTAEELIGEKVEVIFTVPTRIFYQTHLFPLLKMQRFAGEIYITLSRKTGIDIPLLINAERSADSGVTAFAGIVVHNRKQFEDELLAAKKAAETALNESTVLNAAKEELRRHAETLDEQMYVVTRQNEELKQFNHVITHDLQEPLRKLFVFTNMLEQGSDPEAVPRMVGKIRSALDQMRATLSGLQQYVWLTDTHVFPVSVDLQGMLIIIKNELENKYPDVKINLKYENLPVIHADREQVKFMISEVLHNSVNFRKTKDQVNVSIEVSELTLTKYRKYSGKYKYTDFIRIEIRDDGVGFDPVYKDQTFELFKRLHPNSGRGVGLSLCKKIAEMHDGFIHINSAQGNGTTVRILLPVKQELPQQEQPVIEEGANHE